VTIKRSRHISRRQFLRISAVAGVSLALSGTVLKTLLESSELHKIRQTKTQLGTLVTISVIHPDAMIARQMMTDTFDEIERLEAIFSRHRPNSPVARLNRDGSIIDAPLETLEVIQQSIDYSKLTSGAFDITMKPLLDLVERQFQISDSPPDQSAVDHTLPLVSFQNVAVNGTRIELKNPGMAITLDGIAKGYIVDRTVTFLNRLGAENVLVDAGGDMRMTGVGSGGEWKIAIEDPRDAGSFLGSVELKDRSIATSGGYINYFSADLRSHHIIDPRSGISPDHTSAVTVIAKSAMEADALSTAAFVLGSNAGIELLSQIPEVEGIVIGKDQTITKSSGFDLHMS